MNRFRLLFVLSFLLSSPSGKADGTEPARIRIACYNVESLCDTIADPVSGNAEFTPGGPKRWDTERYRQKIARIARVIDDLGADLLALEEVENEAVVRDLMYAMRSDYNYIHRESGDPRGMDVVLLYRGSRFFPSHIRRIFGKGFTRALLAVDGELLGEPVTIVACHLPSQMNAAKYRAEAYRSLRRTVDSLMIRTPQRKLIVLGDFNTEPDAPELRRILKIIPPATGTNRSAGARNTNNRTARPAKNREKNTTRNIAKGPAAGPALYTPFIDLRRRGYGTLAYRDRRQLFDYILFSSGFAAGPGLRYGGHGGIFVRDYLIHRSGALAGYPIRTFRNGRYEGGYSDHLPVFLDFEREKSGSP